MGMRVLQREIRKFQREQMKMFYSGLAEGAVFKKLTFSTDSLGCFAYDALVPNMNDELRQRLLAEISKSGFSHELDIIQRLRAAELVVLPNLAYVDADDKPHEIDAYVTITNDNRRQEYGDVALSLIVECKASNDKSWVFFDDPEDALALMGLVDRIVCFSDIKMQDPYTPLAGCMNSALRGHHYNDRTISVARTHLEAFGKDAGKEIYQGVTSLWYAIDYFKRLFAKSTSNRTSKNRRKDIQGTLLKIVTLYL